MEKALGIAGCTLHDVVDVLAWLKSPRDFVDFKTGSSSLRESSQSPRAVLRNKLMFKSEIKVIAHIGVRDAYAAPFVRL